MEILKINACKKLTVGLLFGSLLMGCADLKDLDGINGKALIGNGKIKKEQRQVSHFDAIQVSRNVEVIYKNDSIEGVTVETDENLQVQVITKLNATTLEIYIPDNVKLKGTPKVYVSGNKLNHIELNAASLFTTVNTIQTEELKVEVNAASTAKINIDCKKVNGDVNAASELELIGKTETFKFLVNAASTLYAKKLLASECKGEVNAGSNATVFASKSIDASSIAGSNLTVAGNPGNRRVNAEASGEVRYTKD